MTLTDWKTKRENEDAGTPPFTPEQMDRFCKTETPRSNYAKEQAERHGAPKPQDQKAIDYAKVHPTPDDDFLADSTPPPEKRLLTDEDLPPGIYPGMPIYDHDVRMRLWEVESQITREGRPENMSDEEIAVLSKKPSVPFDKPKFVEETKGSGFTITITQTAPDVFYGVVKFNSDGRKLSAVHENKHHVRTSCAMLATQNVTTQDINCESEKEAAMRAETHRFNQAAKRQIKQF